MVTAWLMKNYLEYLSGKDVVIEKNTTLNEKYNILADMVIPSNTTSLFREDFALL